MPAVVLILALAFAASPLWVPGFGGFDADQFPIPQVDPPVQPEGYAFAIWGVIYLWLIAGAAFGALRRWAAPDWVEMRIPLAISLAVGSIWLPVAVRSPVWATVLIWVMLISALIALWRSPRLDPWAAAWPGRSVCRMVKRGELRCSGIASGGVRADIPAYSRMANGGCCDRLGICASKGAGACADLWHCRDLGLAGSGRPEWF